MMAQARWLRPGSPFRSRRRFSCGAGVAVATRESAAPIPRRTLWRAQWIVSTLVATFWTNPRSRLSIFGALSNQPSDLRFLAYRAGTFLHRRSSAVAAMTGVVRRTREARHPKGRQASGMFVALWSFRLGIRAAIIVPTAGLR